MSLVEMKSDEGLRLGAQLGLEEKGGMKKISWKPLVQAKYNVQCTDSKP